MTRPRIFVTRLIPPQGLDMAHSLAAEYDIDVWRDPLPLAYEVLRHKAQGVAGLFCLLTDATADFACALLIAAARCVMEGHTFTRSGQWHTWDPIGFLGPDVTEPEPIRPDDPLSTLDNIIIAPHIAGASFQTRNKMAAMAVANLIAGLKDERLPNCVNPEVYA